jgi:hypothetical protein
MACDPWFTASCRARHSARNSKLGAINRTTGCVVAFQGEGRIVVGAGSGACQHECGVTPLAGQRHSWAYAARPRGEPSAAACRPRNGCAHGAGPWLISRPRACPSPATSRAPPADRSSAGPANVRSLLHETLGESHPLREADCQRRRLRALLPFLLAISADRLRVLAGPDIGGQRGLVVRAVQQRVQHRLEIHLSATPRKPVRVRGRSRVVPVGADENV